MKFGDPVYTQSEIEYRRDQKRRAARSNRRAARQLAMLAVGAVGATLLLWQVTLLRPTYVLVALGFVLAVPGVVAIVETVKEERDARE